MTWQHLKAVILLPFMVVIVNPTMETNPTTGQK
jgi:hypothetical protein